MNKKVREVIAKELVLVAKDLVASSPKIARGDTELIIKDFLKKMSNQLDSLVESQRRLEKMQYQETGVGGSSKTEDLSDDIERIDHNLELIDEMASVVTKLSKKLK